MRLNFKKLRLIFHRRLDHIIKLRFLHHIVIYKLAARTALLKANYLTAPHDALIASGHVGLVGYLYHPDAGTHNLNAPVGIQELFLP